MVSVAKRYVADRRRHALNAAGLPYSGRAKRHQLIAQLVGQPVDLHVIKIVRGCEPACGR